MKFNLGQRVKVIKDIHGEWFIGCEGVIEALDKEDLYGLRIYKSNELFTEAHIEIGDSILYFKKEELELI